MTAAAFEARELASRPSATSRRARTVSWIVTALVLLFLAFDITIKLMMSPEAIQGTQELGYPAGIVRPLAYLQLILLVLYMVPRTAPLGAILWTGYLGGAVATHVRLENPLFSYILFPTYVAAFLWLGLWLRDERVRRLTTR